MIKTESAWNYGHTIKLDNKFINFSETGGSGELSATLLEGAYSLTEFTAEVIRAMNDAAEINKYTAVLDRLTRKITIVSDVANFSLLINSGTQVELSSFNLAGFTGADVSGAMTYEGNEGSGEQFIPQFKPQDYTPFGCRKRTSNANILENTKGNVVEVVNFGSVDFMKCTILFQTNITPQRAIKEDAQGVEKLKAFMNYVITKGKIEFMEDILSPAFFTKCIIEKTSLSPKGLDYEITDMKSSGYTNYFTSNPLEFREVS